jgi:enoyl-CoA hydratase/carnithine racemase
MSERAENMITLKMQDRVGRIVIERASAANAITTAMVVQLRSLLREAAESADIVTLQGEGADFTIGRDRHELRTGTPFEAFSNISELNKAIAAFPGILISIVRGRACGLGMGLVMRSDIAIAGSDARFRLDEVEHGIPPMFIMEKIVDHLPAKSALDIVLSGREFDANEALQMGLVSRVVPTDRLDATAAEFVEALRGRDRSVVLACKRYMAAVGKMPADARAAFALVEQTQFAINKH